MTSTISSLPVITTIRFRIIRLTTSYTRTVRRPRIQTILHGFKNWKICPAASHIFLERAVFERCPSQ